MSNKLLNGVVVGFTAEDAAFTEAVLANAAADATAREGRNVRSERGGLLSGTDWAAGSDVTMSAAMKTYRQALRDVPAQEGFPTDFAWPIAP